MQGKGEGDGVVTNVDPIDVDIGPFHIVLPPGTRANEAAQLLFFVARALERGETDVCHLVIVVKERQEEEG